MPEEGLDLERENLLAADRSGRCLQEEGLGLGWQALLAAPNPHSATERAEPHAAARHQSDPDGPEEHDSAYGASAVIAPRRLALAALASSLTPVFRTWLV
jgi:hypothetical protein